MKNHHEKSAAPILTQFLIFSAILLVSYLISLGMIGLLFVPSGISLANSLHLFREEGIKIIVVVILATIILLLSVAYTSKIISKIAGKFSAKRTKIVRGAYND